MHRHVTLAACLLLLCPIASHASEGLYLLGNDALQIGRADSGTASARSAYWSLMNPAALSEFERPQADATFMLIDERITLEPRGLLGNPLDGALNADGMVGFPTGGLVYPFGAEDEAGLRKAFGGGLFVMGGGQVEYNESRSILGRMLYGNRDRKNTLEHAQLALSYAHPLGRGWSVGVGVQASLTRIKTNQLTLSLMPTATDNHSDIALGIGFNLGIYKRWDKFAIGASYKSRQWSQPLDDYRDLVPDSLDYPHKFRAGVAWMPNDRWTITADYEFQRWSQVPPFGEPVLASGLAWGDLHAYKLGVEWEAIEDKLTLMAGYSFSDPVITDDHAFVNAFVPTIIKHHYTAGLTWHINDNHEVHLVYLRSAENALTQNLGGDLIGLTAAGSEITVSANSFAVGYTWKFGP